MQLIDGKVISSKIKEEVKERVEELKSKGVTPGLGIILVGHDPASETYVRNKIKACEVAGIEAHLCRFEEEVSEQEIIDKILEFNQDEAIHGFLVQSPLPKKFNEEYITSFVDAGKDVDGFGVENLGGLAKGFENIIAATPYGIIKMLEHENIEIDGKEVVVVGRSAIVGRPMALALLNRNATVTITHSHTKNLSDVTSRADILVVAIGKPKFITSEYVKEGAVVIDVGTNRTEEGKLVGDVDFENVKDKCSYITRVPGGVGPMTIAMLLNNTVELAEKKLNQTRKLKK